MNTQKIFDDFVKELMAIINDHNEAMVRILGRELAVQVLMHFPPPKDFFNQPPHEGISP